MPFIETGIKDLLIFEPKVFEDSRGYFYESYNKHTFADAGINCEFVQDNQSFSSFGTVRGLHLQLGDSAQAKLVRVIQGEVLDVAVDLRIDSPTYGKHFSVILNDTNHKQLFIPRGFGHGFSVLSETAIFSYKCDNFYDKSAESGIIYNDSDLNIDWKIPAESAIVSDKDKELISFKDFSAKIGK
jgi:dTDP-4-dehydrorhamnose 3,5-epimerase